MAASLDCRQCGACCVNLPSNREIDYPFWVEIEPGDSIIDRSDLVRRLVMYDPENVPHLRIVEEGRCIALRGAVGRDVTCSIYHHRPSPCRRVQPGDELCLRYRAEHGMT